MTLYRGPGGTGTATSDSDTTLFQQFVDQAEDARDAALAAQTAAELAETNAEIAEANAEAAAAGVADDAAAASASASDAATSASNAASSASSASSSASAAAASESNASSSASAASASASAALTSENNAETAETNAAASASAAATSASNAASSASSASTSATNAANSASSASTSATSASNSATAAAASAINASNSATASASSATAAAASASAAATSESNASSSASSAASSASTATTQASNAASSASDAANSASNAATSASNAASSASAASASATNAANSATAASGSATTASNAATAAQAAQTAAEAVYDNFDDRYLGAKSSAPTLDNDGNTLLVGALYFNSTIGQLYAWSGSAWVATSSAASGDVVGPVGATDNALVRFDGTTGKLVQDSTATLSDTGDLSVTSASINGASVTNTTVGNWNTAYGWGNHASAGYLLSSTASTTYQPLDGDLTSIAALAGTSGLLRKTAANTWSLDTASYLTGNQSISLSGDATGSGTTSIAVTLANSGVTAGTYTKVTVDAKGRATAGTSLSSGDVTGALGYTPPQPNGTGASGTWGINISGNSATATTADQIDGVGFRNTGSNAGTAADSLDSNGITYVNNNISLLGQTDGALYSQAYSSAWQHQIYGDYRTGQLVTRGKNSGTWQAWRVQLDSSNYTAYPIARTDISSWQGGVGTRLFRRDGSDNYSVQTYWTGSRWRLYGYVNDSGHADTHVGYADAAGNGITLTSGSAPYYAARAWVNFNGTGTPAIRNSANVSSIGDNGTGDYTVNFSTAMPTADYAPALTYGQGTGAAAYKFCIRLNSNESGAATLMTTSQLRVFSGGSSGMDFSYLNVTIFC